MKLNIKLWHVITVQILFIASIVWAADSRITDLTELTVNNVASGDFLEIVDVSDTTDNAAGSSKKTLLSSVKEFIENQFIATAGSATAGSWLKIASGTVQTTPDDDSIENDGNVLYATTDAGNRGYIPVRSCIRADATRTFTSNTSEQAIFTTPANGRITLETGLYAVSGTINIGSMSASSGNAAFDLIGTGSATLGAILYHIVGVDGSTNTAGTQTGSTNTAAQTPASAVTAGTGTAMTMSFRGGFEVTGAGTLQPSITMVTAAASVLAIGSYICFERLGGTAMTSIGQWD